MPASEILRIVSTVATVQFLCNVTSNWLVFNTKSYHEALDRLASSSKAKQQAHSHEKGGGEEARKGGKADKHAKRIKRADDEHDNAVATVARLHMIPNFLSSIVFFILLRILGAEFKGSVFGVLPFSPFPFLRRFTARGLDFGDATLESTPLVTDVRQACSFMVIYVLCTMSVKFYVNKIFGTPYPPGVEGFTSLFSTDQQQKAATALGFDPDLVKTD